MLPHSSDCWQTNLWEDGHVLLPAVYSPAQVDAISSGLLTAMQRDEAGFALRSEDGAIYGARNLPQLWPPVVDVWRHSPLPAVLEEVLGPVFGLVRVLYFDKPPDQSWALPWHKDLTIAVRDHRRPSDLFGKPTRKAGVPHVEAPQSVLERMLTVRLHLDDVTEENGPLKVIPGSHHSGKAADAGGRAVATVLARRGDVLLMRPLVSHCSNKSLPGTARHRRVLHLEFAADPDLPDGYAWHQFFPGRSSGGAVLPW